MNRTLFLFSACCFLLCACTKEKQKPSPTPGDTDQIKVSLIQGNSQTAETGNFVKDSISIKVTNNGIPLANCDVQFIGSGCNEDMVYQLQTKSDGTAQYLWRLAANQGSQTLNIVALKGGKRADSVMALANATAQSAANWAGACTPYNENMQNISKLSTGRLIANFTGLTALRYSDDNGSSWHPFASLGKKHGINTIATSQADEIFATANDGVYYSKDGGATWLNITPGQYDLSGYGAFIPSFDMTSTNGSKIIITGTLNTVYISPDNGKTWTVSTKGLPVNVGAFFASELNNGNLYLLGGDDVLYQSTDNGQSWVAQHELNSGSYVTAICTGSNGWFYKAVIHSGNPNNYEVYISKDDGLTFTLFAKTDNWILAMSVLQDGHLYYINGSNSSINTFDPGLIPYKVADGLDWSPSNRGYIIAQNHLLYISGGLLRRAN